MSEIMLHDAGKAHGCASSSCAISIVAGADPKLRTGQSTAGATHLIKVACEAALGKRPKIDVFGTDYPTPDGTCIRDYIHVSDLARAHSAALGYLRRGGDSATFNCGYGRGYSVLEVIDAVRRASGRDFPRRDRRAAPRRPGRRRRQRRAHPFDARLAPAIPGPRYHRPPCIRLGKAATGQARNRRSLRLSRGNFGAEFDCRF